MNLHREAMFLEENGCLKAVNEPWGAGSPPLLWAGRTLDGSWQWRSSRILSPQIAAKLEELLKGECFEEIEGLIGASRMEQSVCCRPENLLPDEGMVLTLAELETLDLGRFSWLREELPWAAPCLGVTVEGRLVSVCRSVRIGTGVRRGHEAGVETDPAFRRRGLALQAVRAWAAAVKAQGDVPLYSFDRDNTPSRRLAEKSGFVPYGEGFTFW